MYQMILRIPTELKEQLKKAADERGQTLTGLIRQRYTQIKSSYVCRQ